MNKIVLSACSIHAVTMIFSFKLLYMTVLRVFIQYRQLCYTSYTSSSHVFPFREII
jgi:hypothetical protein